MVPPSTAPNGYDFPVNSRRTDQRNSPPRERHRYPQPTLLRSLLDRRLMGLADRGGASGFVGLAWGDYCRSWLMDQIGKSITVGEQIHGVVDSVMDIDAIPGLAAFASSRALQNPDFVITLVTPDGPMLIAIDAKFSIETAKPRQVSAEILTALLESPGTPVRPLVPAHGVERDGFFITPDYELTHLVLNGTTGILRASVRDEQVCLLDAPPDELFARPDLHALIDALAAIDSNQVDWGTDLVAALYYVRCAFACMGCRIDETKALLGRSTVRELDDPGFLSELVERGRQTSSAWQLVQRWDRDAEDVRAIRIRVHQAAEIGIPNRDLRTLVERESERLGQPTPSMNRIRRELTIWANQELEQRFGTVFHPIPDLGRFLIDLRRAVNELQPEVPAKVREIVAGIAPA
jgi:hypothetical protein